VLAQRPTRERTSIAAASFHFCRATLGTADTHAYYDLTHLIPTLPDATLDQLAEDLRLQNKAASLLSFDRGYYDLMNCAAAIAYERLMKKPIVADFIARWHETAAPLHDPVTHELASLFRDRSPAKDHNVACPEVRAYLDRHQITVARSIAVMQAFCTVLDQTYRRLCPAAYGPSPEAPLRLLGFDYEAASPAERYNQLKVRRDAQGHFCTIADRAKVIADPRHAIEAAFHEAHHLFQIRLINAYYRRAALTRSFAKAAQLIGLERWYGVERLNARVFMQAPCAVRINAFQAYYVDPCESTALYQGRVASLHFLADHALAVNDSTKRWLASNPHLTGFLPSKFITLSAV
jgi:hypothetical protein